MSFTPRSCGSKLLRVVLLKLMKAFLVLGSTARNCRCPSTTRSFSWTLVSTLIEIRQMHVSKHSELFFNRFACSRASVLAQCAVIPNIDQLQLAFQPSVYVYMPCTLCWTVSHAGIFQLPFLNVHHLKVRDQLGSINKRSRCQLMSARC